MKRRIVEQIWPDGTRGFIIQKKTLFGWKPLGKNMTSGYKIYNTMEEAREAILNKPGTFTQKIVYEE